MKARELLIKAREENFSLGAFNAGSFEIIKAIIEAGQALNSALIVQLSANEADFFGMDNFLTILEGFRKKAHFPIISNFDHGPDLIACQKAIEAGFDMVHFDGSNFTYEENVKITKALVEQAHQKGILVEGEIDKIPGASKLHQERFEENEVFYSNPEKLADFVLQTEVDSLAVFVGNLHGVYPEPLRLNLSLLKEIKDRTNCFLCLHGGSGVEAEDIKKALAHVCKINVNTELRIAYRQTLENVLKGTEETAIYKIMPPVVAAVRKVVEEKIKLFNSSQESAFSAIEKLTDSHEV